MSASGMVYLRLSCIQSSANPLKRECPEHDYKSDSISNADQGLVGLQGCFWELASRHLDVRDMIPRSNMTSWHFMSGPGLSLG